MSEVTAFTLHLDGEPQGQPRARFRPGQKPYPDRKQKLAEGEIRRVWQEAGSPRMIDGPLELRVALRVTRPAGHFKGNGSLSAEGLRNPWPHRVKPDLDNAIKLICDAFNGLAWHDDVRVVFVSCHRLWAEWPSTRISVRSALKASLEVEIAALEEAGLKDASGADESGADEIKLLRDFIADVRLGIRDLSEFEDVCGP